MAAYGINKGIGRSAEFHGLQSQYLLFFVGGLLGLFFVVVVLYMAGLGSWFCLLFGAASSSVLVWAVFRLSAKYGRWGLMKVQAYRRRPYYLLSRKRIARLFSSIGQD